MDVTKLFSIPQDQFEPLDSHALDAMIDSAVQFPQVKIPANQNNNKWLWNLGAAVAALIVVVTISLDLSPITVPPATQSAVTSDTASNDAYDDVSDLLMLETIDDLS